MSLAVNACGLSDIGRSRRHNEDSFEIDLDHGLFVVADGMGGHGNGEVASRLAVEAIAGNLRRSLAESGDAAADPGRRFKWLNHAFGEAQDRIERAVREDSALEGMGTTAVGCLLWNGMASVAHVGDSRIYRYRGGKLSLLTEDHTWVQEQVQAGVLSDDEARSHPLKSVVTRALGADGSSEADIRDLELRPGDLLLLCSDGLTTMLDDQRIGQILGRRGEPEELCRELVAAANESGGLDNVTVIVVTFA